MITLTNRFIPDLLTVEQVGDVLHLCRQTVYKHIKDGTIPAFKNPAGKYLIPRKYIEDQLGGCYNVDAIMNDGCPTEGGIRNVG